MERTGEDSDRLLNKVELGLKAVQERIGHAFGDVELLSRALTHRSYAHENDGERDLERLEFLGDSVLNAATTVLLFERFPTAPEGALSKVRNQLVNTACLADIGRSLELGPYIRLGKGERRTGGSDKDRILEDAVEAVAGALMLDGGFPKVLEAARRWMSPRIEALADQMEAGGHVVVENPRNTLQEITQERWGVLPEYEVTGETGPAHAPRFTVVVRVQDQLLGEATGPNKRSAHRMAAEQAVRKLGRSEAP